MNTAIPIITVVIVLFAGAAVLFEYAKPLPGELVAEKSEDVGEDSKDQPVQDGQIELVQMAVLALGTVVASMVTGVDAGAPDRWMTGEDAPNQDQFMRLTVALSAFSIVQESTGDTNMARIWMVSQPGEDGESASQLLLRNEFAAVLTSARLQAAQ